MERKHRNRLLKLAAFLETIPEKRFDMDGWVMAGDDKPIPRNVKLKKAPECSTSACALGWATVAFRDWEFRLYEPRLKKDARPSRSYYRKHGSPSPFTEAEYFFGLTGNESGDLFTPAYDGSDIDTPKGKAEQIRNFVQTGSVY